MCRFRVAGERLWRELRAERDDQRVVGQLAPRGHDRPALGIDRGDLRAHQLDAAMHKVREVMGDLRASAVADHEPEERRREDVVALALDQHDAVLSRQQAAQLVRDRQSADPAAEDDHRAPAHIYPPVFSG